MQWVLMGRREVDERERKVWACVLPVMVGGSVGAWSCVAPDWWVQSWYLDLVACEGISSELQ